MHSLRDCTKHMVYAIKIVSYLHFAETFCSFRPKNPYAFFQLKNYCPWTNFSTKPRKIDEDLNLILVFLPPLKNIVLKKVFSRYKTIHN